MEITETYLWTDDVREKEKQLIIDGHFSGGISKFINHSVKNVTNFFFKYFEF
jgi:hypothetical protein